MPVEKFTMPSGESVYYKDGPDVEPRQRHTYWTGYNPDTGACSGRLPGISTIAKNDGDTNIDGLLGWAARLTCEGVASLASELEDPLPLLRDGRTIGDGLRDANRTWRDMRNAKGDTGNAAHAVLEQLCEGVTPPFSGGHELAVIDWWKKTRPEVVHSEIVVYDHERGFAGRFDLMFNHNSPALLDLKTGAVRTPAVIQLNLYRLACRTSGYRVPERLLILDTKEDGTWKEIEVPIRPEWAIAALETNRVGKEMRSALAQAEKKARRGQSQGVQVLA